MGILINRRTRLFTKPSNFSDYKILSNPGLSRAKQLPGNLLFDFWNLQRQGKDEDKAFKKNRAIRSRSIIRSTVRLPSAKAGFFKMTRCSIGAILFMNESEIDGISRNSRIVIVSLNFRVSVFSPAACKKRQVWSKRKLYKIVKGHFKYWIPASAGMTSMVSIRY